MMPPEAMTGRRVPAHRTRTTSCARSRRERSTQASGLVATGRDRRVVERGIGGDEAGNIFGFDESEDRVELGGIEIRGDLDEERFRRIVVAQGADDSGQGVLVLEIPEPGGIRRADVHDEIVAVRKQLPETMQIVGRSVRQLGDLGFPEVDADRDAGPASRNSRSRGEPFRHGVRSVVVEPHPIDEGLAARGSETGAAADFPVGRGR